MCLWVCARARMAAGGGFSGLSPLLLLLCGSQRLNSAYCWACLESPFPCGDISLALKMYARVFIS